MAARDSSRPAAADRPTDWVLRSSQQHLYAEASGKIMLLVCTAAAMIVRSYGHAGTETMHTTPWKEFLGSL